MTNIEKLFHRYYIRVEDDKQLEWLEDLLRECRIEPAWFSRIETKDYDYEDLGPLALYLHDNKIWLESYFDAKEDHTELFKRLSKLDVSKVKSTLDTFPHTLYEFRDIRWDADKTHVYKYTYVGEDPTSYIGEVIVLDDCRSATTLRKEKWDSLKGSTHESAQQKMVQEAKEWVTYLEEELKDK